MSHFSMLLLCFSHKSLHFYLGFSPMLSCFQIPSRTFISHFIIDLSLWPYPSRASFCLRGKSREDWLASIIYMFNSSLITWISDFTTSSFFLFLREFWHGFIWAWLGRIPCHLLQTHQLWNPHKFLFKSWSLEVGYVCDHRMLDPLFRFQVLSWKDLKLDTKGE